MRLWQWFFGGNRDRSVDPASDERPDKSLSGVSDRISGFQTSHAHSLANGGRFLRLVLSVFGSLAAALGSLAMDEWSWPLSTSALVVVTGSVAVAVSAIHDLLTSEPHVEVLDEARRAVDLAREQNHQNKELYDAVLSFPSISAKLTSLYFAGVACRGHIEQATDLGIEDLSESLRNMLDACAFDLRVALGFSAGDYWTVCIYKTESGVDGRFLKCIASHRAIQCDISGAREWPEGVGVGGVALARSDEVTVSDIYDPSISSAFSAPPSKREDHDKTRYRSMSAVPIMVGNDKRPWGVVLATSSNRGHFDALERDEVDKQEALRMLAGFSALLIAVTAKVDSKNGGAQ